MRAGANTYQVLFTGPHINETRTIHAENGVKALQSVLGPLRMELPGSVIRFHGDAFAFLQTPAKDGSRMVLMATAEIPGLE